MPQPPDLSTLSPTELRDLVIALITRVTELERTVTAQRDEIARLKGLSTRPSLKPSGMEAATQPKPPIGKGKHRAGGGKKTARRVIHQEQVLKAFAHQVRASRATRALWCRIWCCVRMSRAIVASAGGRRTDRP